MKIYIGTDHNGFNLKGEVTEYLKSAGYDVQSDGDEKLDPGDDFPVFAAKVAKDVLVSEDADPRGILLCGSGQGMCIAANRFRGIRACLVWDVESARSSRAEDDSNVLCLPALLIQSGQAHAILDTWLKTPFEAAARYIRRNKELDEL